VLRRVQTGSPGDQRKCNLLCSDEIAGRAPSSQYSYAILGLVQCRGRLASERSDHSDHNVFLRGHGKMLTDKKRQISGMCLLRICGTIPHLRAVHVLFNFLAFFHSLQ
jgi:hypothetical protein